MWENSPLSQELTDMLQSSLAALWLPQATIYRLFFGLPSSGIRLGYLVFTDCPHTICTAAICLQLTLLKCCPTLGLHISPGNFLVISVEEKTPLCWLEGIASNVWIPAAVCSCCSSATGKLCLSMAGLWWPQGLVSSICSDFGFRLTQSQMCSGPLNHCMQIWAGLFCK